MTVDSNGKTPSRRPVRGTLPLVFAALATVLAITLTLIRPDIAVSEEFISLLLPLTIGVIASVASILFLRSRSEARASYDAKFARAFQEGDLSELISEFSSRLEELEQGRGDAEAQSRGKTAWSELDITHYVNQLVEQYVRNTLIDEIRTTIETSDAKVAVQKAIHRQHAITADRLTAELIAIRNRGQLNLGIGIGFATIGLAVLAIVILPLGDPTESSITELLSRLSLVLVVELFAYFFLRLYSATVADTRFFQNELTNAEAKLMALVIAMNSTDDKLVATVVSRLARTERNYILEKGQTTVGLERSKRDEAVASSVTRAVAKVLGHRQ